MRELKKNSTIQFLAAILYLSMAVSLPARQAGDLLTNASDVISLSAERASASLKVLVTGVVTAADPALKGRFFVQDRTGGVFVDNFNGRRPLPGEVVEISGITHAGAYAPIITAPQVRQLGMAPLPEAKKIPIEKLISGSEDSQRIETSGTVREARIDGEHLAADLVSGGYRFRVYAPIPAGTDPQTLVGSQVRVRGTAAEVHNRALRQIVSAEVYVPVPADFNVEKSEAGDPFSRPILPLKGLAQYHGDNSLNDRVHVKGVVTLQRNGENVFLHDQTGGLKVDSRQMAEFSRGEVVEAVGFPSFENHLPVLQDAVFRKTDLPNAAVSARPASLDEIQNGLCHADFVSLKGRIMDKTVRKVHSARSGAESLRTTLVLQGANVLFTAEADEMTKESQLALIPIGSTIEVHGVCFTEIDNDGKVLSFRILLGGPRDAVVLRHPSWLTPKRLLIGLGIACLVLILIASWSIMLSNKNSALKFLIQEREKAQAELQQAHNLLELRVKERTEQLRFQITARKESEVQSKAVLAERTRLAQELHDTLEQTLTGIALQMDTTAKLFQKNPSGAKSHLEIARNLMSQSQVEVRRSIWDLRCRALEQFDLAGALRLSSRQITEGTSILAEVTAQGRIRPLPEVVEDNLLRIGQEGLTNIIKHSEAKLAKIELDYGPQRIVLQIADNGKGFTPDHCIGPHDGHFGLLGISERAKRLRGKVSITSVPGEGTTIRVEIPLDFGADSGTATDADLRTVSGDALAQAYPAVNGKHSHEEV
jgi:signal transduction histidine kinase